MRSKLALAGGAVIFSLSADPGLAAVCLEKSMTLDEIVATIDAAPGCARAMKIFTECEFGASGDVSLGAAVEKKCERDFLARLEEPRKRLYRRGLRICDRKYRNEEGTMYRSFTAFCRAEIAQRYSRRALKAASPFRAR
jgi:MoaA/NifB/PqqE/SkfB family radical SAM enzyme